MPRVDPLPAFPNRRRIGEGGLADVFQSTWEGRPVALKVLRDSDRPGLRKRFLREGRLLQRLRHPGLPTCYAIIDEEPAVLVLELLVGEPLDRRLTRGPLTAEATERLAEGLLDVLAYLHEHGIVHRDVKASNTWLSTSGRVVLMDLGLASDAADPLISTLGEVVGTHAYMAPEQIAGADSDHRCDLYSLGVTLYESLAGARPYHAHGLAGYLSAHRSGLAAPLRLRVPGLPPRLVQFVDRLMSGDPAVRPATARVARALLTGGSTAPVGLAPPRMVGREGARGAIMALLDAGGVLRVTGEIGCGSSVVAGLATDLARADGIEYAVLRGRPRLFVTDVVSQLAAALDRLCGPVPADADAVRAAIGRMIFESGRFLVVCEDLDLAPPSVRSWVAGLASMEGLALLVAGVILPSAPPGRDLHLRPLTLPETRLLVAGMLGVNAVPAGLDVALHRSCGGQPSLIVATLREQAEEGVVWREGAEAGAEARWAWDPNLRLRPSGGASNGVTRFVHTLPVEVREVLIVVGVAGAPLLLDVALAAAGADPSGIDLGVAVRTGLLRVHRQGDDEWVTARRVLVDPAVVTGLAAPERARRHRAIAEAVRRSGDSDWAVRTAALHEALSGDGGEARVVALATDLLERALPGEALHLLDHAPVPAEIDPLQAARRAAIRCDVLLELGRPADARASLRAGKALAAEAGQREAVGPTAEIAVNLYVGAALSDREVEVLAGRAPTDAHAAWLLGVWFWRAGDRVSAEAQLAAVGASPAVGLRDRVACAAALATVRLESGAVHAAVEGWRGFLPVLRGTDRPAASVVARCGFADALRAQGHLALALTTLNQADAAVAGRDLPWAIAEIEVTRLSVELVAGPSADVAHRLATLDSLGHPGVPWSLRARYLDVLAHARSSGGDSQGALAVHLRAADAADAAGDVGVCAFHRGMAALLVAGAVAVGEAVGRLGELERHRLLARVLAVGARHGHDPEIFTAAEVEARASGDVPLLLLVLHLTRGPGAREEAGRLATLMLNGLYGPLRRRMLAYAPVRWAVGEP